jgi:hypothetical protein
VKKLLIHGKGITSPKNFDGSADRLTNTAMSCLPPDAMMHVVISSLNPQHEGQYTMRCTESFPSVDR